MHEQGFFHRWVMAVLLGLGWLSFLACPAQATVGDLSFYDLEGYGEEAINPLSKTQQEAQAKREKILLDAAIKAYTPPPAGIMPVADQIPMANLEEDPNWDTPEVVAVYANPFSYDNNLDLYLPCLREALCGNAKAMLALAMFYYSWEHTLRAAYPELPSHMHNQQYWIDWATRVTNPGWVETRLGDLHGRWLNSATAHYRRGAELGNAEAMYKYYKLTGRNPHYLYISAAAGYPKAAFALAEEYGKIDTTQSQDLARRYIWLAALGADEWGLLHASINFHNGNYGECESCDLAYLYATLAVRYKPGTIEQKSTARAENTCGLPADVVLDLEELADAWQVALEDRRRPTLESVRLHRDPLIAELRAELAPVVAALEDKPQELHRPTHLAQSSWMEPAKAYAAERSGGHEATDEARVSLSPLISGLILACGLLLFAAALVRRHTLSRRARLAARQEVPFVFRPRLR